MNFETFIEEKNICSSQSNSKIKISNKLDKELIVSSIGDAINELNEILEDISKNINLKTSPNKINNLLYYSFIMLIDELEYIKSYIAKIEESIDISVFDTAKKLNDSIVNLIGHRKDILFKIIETTCKIQEYLIKWKKLFNETQKQEGDGSDCHDWFKEI